MSKKIINKNIKKKKGGDPSEYGNNLPIINNLDAFQKCISKINLDNKLDLSCDEKVGNKKVSKIIEQINDMKLLVEFNSKLIKFLQKFEKCTIKINGNVIPLFIKDNGNTKLNELEYSKLINGQLTKSDWPSEEQKKTMIQLLEEKTANKTK